MEKQEYMLSSVASALRLMDLLSQYDELSLAEICKLSGLGKARAFRLLYTLEEYEYVLKSAQAKYRLSTKFAYYGTLVISRQDLVWTARPFLQRLRDLSGQTTHLAVIGADGKSTFLYKESSNNTIQMLSYVGSSMDAYSTATGKALLAYLDDDALEKAMQGYQYFAYTEKSTILTDDDLLRQLALIRSRGYAEDLEEHEIGLTCYAAPVFNYSGACVAAISASGSTGTMQKEHDSIIGYLLQVSGELSRELGFRQNRPPIHKLPE